MNEEKKMEKLVNHRGAVLLCDGSTWNYGEVKEFEKGSKEYASLIERDGIRAASDKDEVQKEVKSVEVKKKAGKAKDSKANVKMTGQTYADLSVGDD